MLEASDTAEFSRKCEVGTGRDLIAPINELVRQASDARIKIVFVEMPMHPARLHFFYGTHAWEQYRAHVQALLVARQVTYIDASRWMVGEEMFADRLHLTEAAATKFSERLGRLLSQDLAPAPSP